MASINPFYRFQDSFNAGFFPVNQRISNCLESFYTSVDPFISVILGAPFFGALSQIKSVVEAYNKEPYLAGFNLIVSRVETPTEFENHYSLRNESLYAADNTQEVVFDIYYDKTSKLITYAYITPFSAKGFANLSSASPLMDVELSVQKALYDNEEIGSGQFPAQYFYDENSGIAYSGLARAKNWQIALNGFAQRYPADTSTRQCVEKFTLPALSEDEKQILALLDRIILRALKNPSVARPPVETNYPKLYDLSLPSGWLSNNSIDESNPSNYRYQIDVFNPSADRLFSFIARYDGSRFTWQRFIKSNDVINYPSDFLSLYSNTEDLPYQPTDPASPLYFSHYYDLELCQFPDCEAEKEFYPMPIKTGDEIKFNVPFFEANSNERESVKLGLFTENGDFVTQIGLAENSFRNCDAVLQTSIFKNPADSTFLPWGTIRLLAVYGLLPTEATNWNYGGFVIIYGVSSDGSTKTIARYKLAYSLYGIVGDLDTATTTTFISDLTNKLSQKGIYITTNVTNPNSGGVNNDPTIIDITFQGEVCCFVGIDFAVENIVSEESPTPNKYLYRPNYGVYTPKTSIPVYYQLKAQGNIPSLPTGCYRLGLYDDRTCEFVVEFEQDITEFLEYINNPELNILGVSFNLYDYGTNQNIQVNNGFIQKPEGGFTADNIGYLFGSVPNVNTKIIGSTFFITWTILAECNANFFGYLTLVDQQGAVGSILTSNDFLCECEETGITLFSLSNLLSLDNSECYSTVVEFWDQDGTLAQGFEYDNGWTQKVRLGINGGGQKPIITESLYRQTNGVHKRPQNKQDLSVDLHTDFLDLETQKALVDATRHPFFVWNGQNIFVSGDIEVATIQDFTTQSSFEGLAQVKFSALVQAFQPKNNKCLNC